MPSPATAAERAEARDPATPPERLAALLGSCTEEVLANPGLPLLLVSEPDFWARVAPDDLFDAAASAACPLSLAHWLTHREQHPELPQYCVFANRALPREVRRASLMNWSSAHMVEDAWDKHFACLSELLTPSEYALLRRGATQTLPSDLSLDAFQQLAALGKWGQDLATWQADCPAEVLVPLAERGNLRVLSHRNMPRSVLEHALDGANVEARKWAIVNPTMTAADLRKAVQDPVLQRLLVDLETLPEECYAVLLAVPDRDLQEHLAMNPGLPASAVAALIARGDVDQLAMLAHDHPRLTPEAQLALATHPEAHVRKHLRENPALTVETRRALG